MAIHTLKAWLEHTKSLSKSQWQTIFMPTGDADRTARLPKENGVMPDLANKTALVTGASRGMGRAAALALAAGGARVIVHYGRNADEAKAVVDQIWAARGRGGEG